MALIQMEDPEILTWIHTFNLETILLSLDVRVLSPQGREWKMCFQKLSHQQQQEGKQSKKYKPEKSYVGPFNTRAN